MSCEGDRWLEIRVRPESPFPHQQFLSTPYSLHAAVADVAFSGAPDDEWRISGNNVFRLIGNIEIGTTDSRSQYSFTAQLRQWNGTAWVPANGIFYCMVVGRE